ncbi:pentapeptide repeat-containing protein [Micromonospora sp. CA-244673]|uniref:pentapeptide repeat-containing protein n=1 Tax=Micromonospora sp. CA-244673 TaxID=3239958 RepID=UPI003D8C38FC
MKSRQAPEPRWQRWAGQATALAAIGALAVSTISIYYTGRSVDATQTQVRIQEQGQITERFARAVEQLGSAQASVRLGAIYSLERLMRDSPADQPTIMEVLCGFVRERSPNKENNYNPHEFTWKPFLEGPWVRRFTATDVQAAVSVLGRRNAANDGSTRVDLSGADLDGAVVAGQFQRAKFSRSSLVKARLEGLFDGADLTEADLARAEAEGVQMTEVDFSNARLDQADLDYARLWSANLTRSSANLVSFKSADLRNADLSDAKGELAFFPRAKLRGAFFVDAQLPHAWFGHADLQDANFLRADLRGARLSDAENVPAAVLCVRVDDETELPPAMTVNRTDCKPNDLAGPSPAPTRGG